MNHSYLGNKNQNVSFEENLANSLFINASEIMKLFKVTRPTFDKWKKTENFPKAIILSRRSVWMTEEIINWAFKHKEGNSLCREFQ